MHLLYTHKICVQGTQGCVLRSTCGRLAHANFHLAFSAQHLPAPVENLLQKLGGYLRTGLWVTECLLKIIPFCAFSADTPPPFWAKVLSVHRRGMIQSRRWLAHFILIMVLFHDTLLWWHHAVGGWKGHKPSLEIACDHVRIAWELDLAKMAALRKVGKKKLPGILCSTL